MTVDLLASKRFREQRAPIAQRIMALADAAIAENGRAFTPDEEIEWRLANHEFDDLTVKIARADRPEGDSMTRTLPGREDGFYQHTEDGDEWREGRFDPEHRDEGKPSDADLALAGWLRNVHGVPLRRDEAEAAHRLGVTPGGAAFEIRLQTCRPTLGREVRFEKRLSSQVGATGGFTIPGGFIPRLEKSMQEVSGMLTSSEVMVTTDAHELLWPTLDDATNEGSRIGESTASSDSDLTFGALVMRAYKYSSGMLKAPHELIRDSGVPMASEIGAALGSRLGRSINRAATEGTGAAGSPTGILTASVVGKTTASATAIAFDELVELQHSVDPAYRANAKWMMSDGVASYIRRLKDGSGNYLWQDSVQEGMPARLLGAAVVINNHMQATVATGTKTVLWGDLSMFKIRLVGAVRFRQLNERYADTDQLGFIAFMEVDCNLLKPASSATLCPVKHLLQL